jgi:hypothetical protein
LVDEMPGCFGHIVEREASCLPVNIDHPCEWQVDCVSMASACDEIGDLRLREAMAFAGRQITSSTPSGGIARGIGRHT